MTSNLLHGGADVDDFRRALVEIDPDIVVTQELGDDYINILSERFPNHYLHPADDFKGRGIATRFDVEFGDIPMPVRHGTSALVDVGGEPWSLAGVHLLNPIDFPWWTSVRCRGKQLEAIDRWSRGANQRLVIAGDFNASPLWPAYRFMAQRWNDLVADQAAMSGGAPDRTWAWRPGGPRMLRIDHVFGSGVIATSSGVVPIRGSDHAAVWVDLVPT